MATFMDIFSKRHDASTIFDLEFYQSEANKTYLKEIALNTVINFVARSISQSEFRVYQKGKLNNGETTYKLNVRPNSNQSAGIFWHKLVYKLLKDSEVLVVSTDTNELLVADSFTQDIGKDLYPKTFKNVQIGNFNYTRTFSMDDVWYLTYANAELRQFVDQLGEDISSLYTRMIETAKRNNQLRAIVDIDATTALDADSAVLQKYLDDIRNAIKNNSVAIMPQMKGYDYQEKSNSQGVGKESISDLSILQNQLVDTVAGIIGVPPALIHGQNEKLESNIKSYLKFCLNPLIDMIEDELNAKLFKKEEFMSGNQVKVIGLNKPDILELAESVDKLISSSSFSPNEIRERLGYEPRAGGDKYVLTKNYNNDDLKGGDKNEDRG